MDKLSSKEEILSLSLPPSLSLSLSLSQRTIRFRLSKQFMHPIYASELLTDRIIAAQTTRRVQFVSLRSGSDMSYIPVAIDERPQQRRRNR